MAKMSPIFFISKENLNFNFIGIKIPKIFITTLYVESQLTHDSELLYLEQNFIHCFER